MVATKAPKAPKVEPAGVSADLRKAHSWFETLAEKVKELAVTKRKKTGRTKGKELPPEQVVKLADELENIQRQINPLDVRRKEIIAELLGHWAHTGVEEIEGTLGKTLISSSFQLAVNPAIVQKGVSVSTWLRITERTIDPAKLLSKAKNNEKLRTALDKALLVRKVTISVTPPSSRRAKSGALEEGDEE
jgi:hypothetical protein